MDGPGAGLLPHPPTPPRRRGGAGDDRRDDRPGRRALRLWLVSAERRDAAGRGGVQTGSRRHGARRRRVGARRFAPAAAPRRPSEKPGADGHLRLDQLAGRDVGPLVGVGHRDRGELFHSAQGGALHPAGAAHCRLPGADQEPEQLRRRGGRPGDLGPGQSIPHTPCAERRAPSIPRTPCAGRCSRHRLGRGGAGGGPVGGGAAAEPAGRQGRQVLRLSPPILAGHAADDCRAAAGRLRAGQFPRRLYRLQVARGQRRSGRSAQFPLGSVGHGRHAGDAGAAGPVGELRLGDGDCPDFCGPNGHKNGTVPFAPVDQEAGDRAGPVFAGLVAGFLLAVPLGQIGAAPPALAATLLGLPLAGVCLLLLAPWVQRRPAWCPPAAPAVAGSAWR